LSGREAAKIYKPRRLAMTEETKTNNTPEFRVFVNETQEDGSEKRVEVGAAWLHSKGGGMNLTIKDGHRMVLFPTKKE
jgi:hypothetical protein